MSDYLGPNQTRVLDPTGRNFETVVYQRKKPPLSCEVNLTGELSAAQAQERASLAGPSGWVVTGALRDNIAEAACGAGDILCSSTLSANTFKLISLDQGVQNNALVAWVNGWKLLIQGSSSLDDNNIIELPAPPTLSTRIDFVFLEVWRKLITPTDVIYTQGNVLYGGLNFENDLIDPAIDIETTLRIQIQYRIRVASVDLENYPDGFDPNSVFVQGPLPYPISTCSHAYFSPVPGDLGLWRAGVGDTAAQETLQTVDGYTYAIPLFAVHRRNTSAYDPDDHSNGAGYTLADYLTGYASDRPDNKYSDWVVSDDILDMRHKILNEGVKELCEAAFNRLVHGDLRNKMTKVTLGEDHWGTVTVQADAISPVDHAGSNRIASGDAIRRVFSNAQVDQAYSLVQRTVNEKTLGFSGFPWVAGDQVQLYTSGYPTGSVILSVQNSYVNSGSLSGTDITLAGTGTGTVIATIPSGSSLIGTSLPITFDYTIRFASGPYGLSTTPIQFLECRKEDSTVCVASQDADIRLRTSAPVVNLDGTHFNMLANRGGHFTDPFDFGHQMYYHVSGNGTSIITIPRTIEGYPILGILSAMVGTSNRIFSVTRTSTQYIINLGSPSVAIGRDVLLTLYTGVKFFEVNKQGRAIINTFEMAELRPLESADGGRTTFHVDSTNKAILSLASNVNTNGYGLVYVDGVLKTLQTNSVGLPTDTTKSRATVQFSLADTPAAGATIEIPVLMQSAIGVTEGYSFFYKTIPYQGILDSTVTGLIETMGPAITTTSGSGTITNLTITEGKAYFSDSTMVYGNGTNWLTEIQPGFMISADSNPDREFVISAIYDDLTLSITNKPDFISAVGGEAYKIVAKDLPSFNLANLIDRLPALDADNDYRARNESISTAVSDAYPVIETRVISRTQDIFNLEPNTVQIGTDPADRGRAGIHIPDAYIGKGNLGLKFEKLDSTCNYHKTYQAYVLNRNNTGELVMLVVGSETDNTSASCFFDAYQTKESVDIFDMPGRPITNKR
jgi:hypothetical protein